MTGGLLLLPGRSAASRSRHPPGAHELLRLRRLTTYSCTLTVRRLPKANAPSAESTAQGRACASFRQGVTRAHQSECAASRAKAGLSAASIDGGRSQPRGRRPGSSRRSRIPETEHRWDPGCPCCLASLRVASRSAPLSLKRGPRGCHENTTAPSSRKARCRASGTMMVG